jgi:hypothetical protein
VPSGMYLVGIEVHLYGIYSLGLPGDLNRSKAKYLCCNYILQISPEDESS